MARQTAISINTIPIGPLGIIGMPGCEELTDKIDQYLVKWRKTQAIEHAESIAFFGYQRDSYKIDITIPRFGSGEGKGVINESVRGYDIYIVCDVFNYSCTYNMYGKEVCMSPDDHFADLKRVISALCSKPKRVSVIMPMLYEGRIVEARVIAVAPKAVRLEVFGVEVSVRARDMAWEWMVDAGEKFQVGDLVLVMVNKVEASSVDQIIIEVDAKSPTANINKDNLRKCHKQGKYTGIITEVYKGTYFIRLDIGVNAVAHSCNMSALPGKKDKIGFVVTRINDNYEVAEGIITRLIKRAS